MEMKAIKFKHSPYKYVDSLLENKKCIRTEWNNLDFSVIDDIYGW